MDSQVESENYMNKGKEGLRKTKKDKDKERQRKREPKRWIEVTVRVTDGDQFNRFRQGTAQVALFTNTSINPGAQGMPGLKAERLRTANLAVPIPSRLGRSMPSSNNNTTESG